MGWMDGCVWGCFALGHCTVAGVSGIRLVKERTQLTESRRLHFGEEVETPAMMRRQFLGLQLWRRGLGSDNSTGLGAGAVCNLQWRRRGSTNATSMVAASVAGVAVLAVWRC